MEDSLNKMPLSTLSPNIISAAPGSPSNCHLLHSPNQLTIENEKNVKLTRGIVHSDKKGKIKQKRRRGNEGIPKPKIPLPMEEEDVEAGADKALAAVADATADMEERNLSSLLEEIAKLKGDLEQFKIYKSISQRVYEIIVADSNEKEMVDSIREIFRSSPNSLQVIEQIHFDTVHSSTPEDCEAENVDTKTKKSIILKNYTESFQEKDTKEKCPTNASQQHDSDEDKENCKNTILNCDEPVSVVQSSYGTNEHELNKNTIAVQSNHFHVDKSIHMPNNALNKIDSVLTSNNDQLPPSNVETHMKKYNVINTKTDGKSRRTIELAEGDLDDTSDGLPPKQRIKTPVRRSSRRRTLALNGEDLLLGKSSSPKLFPSLYSSSSSTSFSSDDWSLMSTSNSSTPLTRIRKADSTNSRANKKKIKAKNKNETDMPNLNSNLHDSVSIPERDNSNRIKLKTGFGDIPPYPNACSSSPLIHTPPKKQKLRRSNRRRTINSNQVGSVVLNSEGFDPSSTKDSFDQMHVEVAKENHSLTPLTNSEEGNSSQEKSFNENESLPKALLIKSQSHNVSNKKHISFHASYSKRDATHCVESSARDDESCIDNEDKLHPQASPILISKKSQSYKIDNNKTIKPRIAVMSKPLRRSRRKSIVPKHYNDTILGVDLPSFSASPLEDTSQLGKGIANERKSSDSKSANLDDPMLVPRREKLVASIEKHRKNNCLKEENEEILRGSNGSRGDCKTISNPVTTCVETNEPENLSCARKTIITEGMNNLVALGCENVMTSQKLGNQKPPADDVLEVSKIKNCLQKTLNTSHQASTAEGKQLNEPIIEHETTIHETNVVTSATVTKTTNDEPSNVNPPKPKRRRRSSFGGHIGGMISQKDIEAIERESAAPKKNRSKRSENAKTSTVSHSVREEATLELKTNVKVENNLPEVTKANEICVQDRTKDILDNRLVTNEGNEGMKTEDAIPMSIAIDGAHTEDANKNKDNVNFKPSEGIEKEALGEACEQKIQSFCNSDDLHISIEPYGKFQHETSCSENSEPFTFAQESKNDIVPREERKIQRNRGKENSKISSNDNDTVTSNCDVSNEVKCFSTGDNEFEVGTRAYEAHLSAVEGGSREKDPIRVNSNDTLVEKDKDKFVHVSELMSSSNSSIFSVAPIEQLDRTYTPTGDQIKFFIDKVFSESDALNKDCMSARLFACACLILEKHPSLRQILCTTTETQTFPIHCIYPLMIAFVNAEVASLGESQFEGDHRKDRKLHFCSFDYSTTIPAVDTIAGSNSHLEHCISFLYKAVKEMHDLCRDPIKDEVMSCLNVLINLLRSFEAKDRETYLEECAKAMPTSWSRYRFRKAAKQYRMELEELTLLMTNRSVENIELNSRLRQQLGDLIGRAIRFYLRRFFNPTPFPLTTPSEKHPPEDYSSIRSRVHLFLQMSDSDGADRDTATADGSISSVLGLAIRKIYDFFCLNEKLASENSKYITQFCARPASKRGLKDRGSTIILSDEDLQEIISDISEAHTILSGVRACTFVRDLMNWPGVAEAVQEMGGWSKVEFYSTMYLECGLEVAYPDEAHFVLLSDIKKLIRRLNDDEGAMAEVELECEDALRLLWKRFRCGTKNKQVLKMNPGIKIIQTHLKEEKQTTFPCLTSTTEE